MFRNLLVPLDGSSFAEQALPLALNIAERADATLHLAMVHTPLGTVYGGGEFVVDGSLDAMIRERQSNYLIDVERRLRAPRSVPYSSALLEGPVTDSLCEHALAKQCDLIVLATHGRGAFSRFWLGSVADQLIRRATVPVLLVRPGEKPADLAARPELGRILIPLDGSNQAEQILGPATELGGLMKAQYRLLRVVEPIVLPEFTYRGPAIPDECDRMALKKAETDSQAYLDGVADRLRSRSFHVSTRVLTNQPAAIAIAEEAKAAAVDLVALETHGRRGLARLMLGSVADKVVRGVPTAVLIHHPVVK